MLYYNIIMSDHSHHHHAHAHHHHHPGHVHPPAAVHALAPAAVGAAAAWRLPRGLIALIWLAVFWAMHEAR